MFAPPPVIGTEIFTRLPEDWRWMRETDWSNRRGSGPLHSFLEGPSFDRAGNLYCVDIPHGRIFRISPDGTWHLFAHYDGNPNGLKIHRDGRIFVTDQLLGLLIFDPATGNRIGRIETPGGESFKAVNDLFFGPDGALYITDPGGSSIDDPCGKVYRWHEGKTFELVADALPYPNGLVLEGNDKALLIALSRTLQIVRAPVAHGPLPSRKLGLFIQMSGGLAGPDGMALDEAGSILVCHSGMAAAWLFDRLGEPIARIQSAAGIRITNAAYGGRDRRDLYLTESEDGVILRARMKVPGRAMFSHGAWP